MAKVRSTYEPRWYRHLPTTVEGVIYDGTVDCARAIVEWGKARTGNLPFNIEGDDLHAYTRQGQRYVPESDMATLGVLLEPYSVSPDVRQVAYVLVDGADHRAVLSSEQVQAIRTAAELATDPKALREMVAQLAGSHEAQRS